MEQTFYRKAMDKYKPYMLELSRIHSPFNWDFWTVGEQNITPIHRFKFTLHQFRLRTGETERISCDLELKKLDIEEKELEIERLSCNSNNKIGIIEFKRATIDLRKLNSEYELMEIELLNKVEEMKCLEDILDAIIEPIEKALGRKITYEDYANEEPIYWFRDIVQKCYNSVIANGRISKGEANAMRRFIEHDPALVDNIFFQKLDPKALLDPVKVEILHKIINSRSVAECKKLFIKNKINNILEHKKAEWVLLKAKQENEFRQLLENKAKQLEHVQCKNEDEVNGK